ncbi:hypothetical protein QYE76_068488 [Lolium multiflorum]|uniref:CCHC-type domain-containing protein n=1 Tax=Lolium multiflorum TaxID=4521 RepID=A0AAD8SGD2_LOLMU|nr:hypothetical protein QYE76_068488 [Lolium multiflorum]
MEIMTTPDPSSRTSKTPTLRCLARPRSPSTPTIGSDYGEQSGGTGVEANEKVLFATHYLAGPARAWWTSTRAMNGGQFMTWEDFKLKFSKYHVPPGLIKKMRDEFHCPRQHPFADLEALVDSAIQMEGKLNQANENRKRRMASRVDQATPKVSPSSSGGFTPETTNPDAELARLSNRSGGNSKPGGYKNNYNNNNYNCAPPRAPNNNNTNTNTTPRTGSNAVPVANKQDKSTITCYECGVVGHYSNECPKRLSKLAGNTAAPAQQQRRVSTGKKFTPTNRNGRLYHMNAEEAQEAPDVVLVALGERRSKAIHGHAGHAAQPDNLPLSSFTLCPGHRAIDRHRTSLVPPSTALVEEELDNARTTRAQTCLDAARVATMRAMDAHRPRAAQPPRARPGPPFFTKHTAVTPQPRRHAPSPNP